MLRRSWLPLCLWVLLGTSLVSLVAAHARHRSDSALHKRTTHTTHHAGGSQTGAAKTGAGVEGPSTGAEGGSTAAGSGSSHGWKTSGFSLHGLKAWVDHNVTKLKRALTGHGSSDPPQAGTSGGGNGQDPSSGTGISLASGGTRGSGGSSGSAGSHSKKHGSPQGTSGSGTAGTPAATGGGGSSGSGTGTSTSDPVVAPVAANGTGGGSSTGSGSAAVTGASGSGNGTSSTAGGNASGSGGGSSSGSGGGSAGDPPPSGETRDPAYWPFAADSPWNYPIGSNAQYVDFTVAGARRPAAGTGMKLGMDANTSVTWVGQQADPVRTWSYGSAAIPMHIADGAAPTGGEGLMTFVDVGHLFAQDSYGSSRDGNGNWAASGALVNVLLKGAGHGFGSATCLGPNVLPDYNWCLGQTRGSGLPLFAGTVRPGELTNGIRHALALIVGREYLRRSPGHVWPAEADDGADGYTGGPSCNYSLGQLVAIPWSVDVESLPLRLPQSRNIARALQRYGAYSVDTSGGLFDVVVDYRAISEWYSWLNDPNWANDMYEVIGSQLRVVANGFNPTNGGSPRNGVKLDGGDGALNAPLAPPFDR